jgi:hypothetical protein
VVLVRVAGLLLLSRGWRLRLLVEGLALLSRGRGVAVDLGEDGTGRASDGGRMTLHGWGRVLRLRSGSGVTGVRVRRGGSVRVVGVLVVVGLERFGDGRRERLLIRLLLVLVLLMHHLGDGRWEVVLMRDEANETRLRRKMRLVPVDGGAASGTSEKRAVRDRLAVAPLQARPGRTDKSRSAATRNRLIEGDVACSTSSSRGRRAT